MIRPLTIGSLPRLVLAFALVVPATASAQVAIRTHAGSPTDRSASGQAAVAAPVRGEGGFASQRDGSAQAAIAAPARGQGGFAPQRDGSAQAIVAGDGMDSVPIGAGSAGCDGAEWLSAATKPLLGTTLVLVCDHAPASSMGIALIADAVDAAGSDPFGLGFVLHLDLESATEIYDFEMRSDSTGLGSVSIEIPNDPRLVGATYFAQALWIWGECTLGGFGISSSNALGFTVHERPSLR